MSVLLTPSPVVQLPHLKKGQIQVIFGPMFSGKTTELIRRCRRYQIANYKCAVVKYARDQRYTETNQIATHDEQRLAAFAAIELQHVRDQLREYEVIGIDEGQFFPDIIETCEQLANEGKTVIVAALDGTFQREGFGRILELVPKAEHVIKLTAVCMNCYNDAAFTKRFSEDTTIEVIGGSEMYSATCRDCHAGKTPQLRHASSQTPIKDDSDKRQFLTEAIGDVLKAKCKLRFDSGNSDIEKV